MKLSSLWRKDVAEDRQLSGSRGRLFLLTAGTLVIGSLAGGAISQKTVATTSITSQYEHGSIVIPAATPTEPTLSRFSPQLAESYLLQGTVAWTRERGCVSCHTNGSYMTIRPALSSRLGSPSEEMRNFFTEWLKDHKAKDRGVLAKKLGPSQVIYVAAGLAEWDAHVDGRLSPETSDAMELMFSLQLENGIWLPPSDCWPPFESDAYHGATLAAMAVGTAPGWLEGPHDPSVTSGIQALRQYLSSTEPPHDYGRLWLLRASMRFPGLIDSEQQEALIDMVWSHQRPDGGWSIRTFAKPEEWGSGNRASKLRNEIDFENPASDGHQTGLSILALGEAGVQSDDPRIQRGIQWLLANQKASGRWWTRSLNTDRWHFITYSGTGYAMQALAMHEAF